MKFADGSGNLEIVIYIIAIIVGLAVNAYRNYSKRNAKEQPKPNKANPDFPEILFDSGLPEQEQTYEESEPEEREVVISDEEHVEENEEYVDQPVAVDVVEEREGVPALHFTAEQLNTAEINEFGIEMPDNLYSAIADSEHEITDLLEEVVSEVDAFDLRQAVIFSEILNSKYINSNY